MSDEIERPTSEQCSANARLPDWNGMHVYAAWYPQMGGYVGRAVVRFHPDDGSTCFDALVWHNGEFPFDDENPRELHHCCAKQFVDFGKTVLKMQGIERNEQSRAHILPLIIATAGDRIRLR